jgi:putative endonuclease
VSGGRHGGEDRRRGRGELERAGRLAEALAAWSLRLRGYRVLARRFRTPVGEIDLVVRRGRCVAFVEVKARRGGDEALHALGSRQRARIARAAEWFLKRHPQHAAAGCTLRFDLVTVVPWRLPRLIPDAWRPE